MYIILIRKIPWVERRATMKRRALLALLIIMLLVLMGCTGCDADPTSIDLTQERAILINPGGWIAQEEYTVEDVSYYKLLIMQLNEDNYMVSISDKTEKQNVSAVIQYNADEVLFRAEAGNYSLRITSEAEKENPVLTLTSVLDGEKMYFSMGGTE